MQTQNSAIVNKVRASVHDKVNEATLDWFRAARSKNLPVSGPILQERAREFAAIYNDTSFTASNRWLSSFKNRNALVFNTVCGEARDVSQTVIDEWLDKLPSLIIGYEVKDIANCDETALFFRPIPQKSIALKDEKCSGGKLSKERLSVLLCAFADGKFEKPLVIGKSLNPRSFKNLNKAELPVHWFGNRNAWMTTTIMECWLKQFNQRMKRQNRKDSVVYGQCHITFAHDAIDYSADFLPTTNNKSTSAYGSRRYSHH